MNRLFSNYIRNHSLKSVIATYVFLLSFAALLLFTKVSDFFMSNIIVNNYLTSYMNSIYSSFEYTMNDMITHINISLVNLTTWNEFYTVILDNTISESEKKIRLHNYTSKFLNNDDLIAAVDIITLDGAIYQNSKNGIILPQIDSKFIDTIVPAKISIYNKPILSGNEYYIAIGNKFQNFYTGIDIGYLIFYIPESTFHSAYQESLFNDSNFFILADDCIISHNDKSMLGSKIFLPQDQEDKQMAVAKYAKNIISKNNLQNSSLASDISVVIMQSTDSLFRIVNQLKFYIYCIFGIALLLALIVSSMFTQRLLNQYIQFKQDIQELAQNPEKKITFRSSNELRELEDSFNAMVKTINKLIGEISITQAKQRDAEIKALQSHINPHFIYNALDTITCMAKLANQPNIEQTSYALASFFRIGLSGGEKFITLQNEIKHVKSYLQIQQTRFPDKFEVEFDIPDALLNCKILKITLQPLVENCVKHAFKNVSYIGKIKITAQATAVQDFLILTVADNGIGFQTNPLTIQKENKTGSGYGIYNVQQRLKLEYGENCGLSYKINETGGTSVNVKIKYLL